MHVLKVSYLGPDFLNYNEGLTFYVVTNRSYVREIRDDCIYVGRDLDDNKVYIIMDVYIYNFFGYFSNAIRYIPPKDVIFEYSTKEEIINLITRLTNKISFTNITEGYEVIRNLLYTILFEL